MINTWRVAFTKSIKTFFQSSRARTFSTIIAVVVTFLILGSLIYRQREVLFAQKWTFHWQAFVAAFLFYSVAMYLAVLSWVLILEAMGLRIKFWNHFRYYCVSMLARRLPGTIWYIAYRSQMYQKEGLSIQLTSLASGVEMAVTIISGVLISSLFAIPLLKQYQAGMIAIWVMLILCFSFLHPRVIGWVLKKFGSSIDRFEYRKILLWVVVLTIMRIFGGTTVFAIINMFYPLPLNSLIYVIGCWAFVGVLSSALLFFPTNLGFTEVSMSLLLSSIMPSPIAVLAAVLCRITLIFFEFVWAVFILAVDKVFNKPL